MDGYGYATLPNDTEDEVDITPHSLFYVGSTTKSFIAATISLIVDNSSNDIDWTTPLHKIAPNDFVLEDDYLTTHITFEDALSHRTGMPRHDFTWLFSDPSWQEMVRDLRHLPISAPFRTTWQYCNLMYHTVTYMIQVITGTWTGDVLQKYLWDPLGMNETYFGLPEAMKCQDENSACNLAVGYVWNNESSTYESVPWEDMPPPNGAGGIVSNVMDFTKWIRVLMNEDGPISKASHTAMKYPHSIEEAKSYPFTGPTWYGFGIFGAYYRGHLVYFHNGQIGGYVARMTWIPDLKWGVATMQNAANLAQDVLTHKLIDDFLETPENERAKMNE
ncbi:hypothetical protein M8818_007242 [Zalaria obscura]|uniref:Uncharacterized protein n=1 Tax=Zalaria obscura TaxID=2024903 RepID=A0ACC3S5G1_9PEZI